MKKANDNIPKDEMLLAKLIGAASARGLKGCRGAYFKAKIRGRSEEVTETCDGIYACCALGAAKLARVGFENAFYADDAVALGNDASAKESMPASYVNNEDLINNWNVGAAFHLAMK